MREIFGDPFGHREDIGAGAAPQALWVGTTAEPALEARAQRPALAPGAPRQSSRRVRLVALITPCCSRPTCPSLVTSSSKKPVCGSASREMEFCVDAAFFCHCSVAGF